MSTVARRIAASPKRTATEVWEVISKILCERLSPADKELSAITGIVAAIISEEIPQDAPFIVMGTGPRVRIYCQYGKDALGVGTCNENPLAQKPTINSWQLYIPCATEDMEWVGSALKNLSSHAIVYDSVTDPDIPEEAFDQKGLILNRENFLTKL